MGALRLRNASYASSARKPWSTFVLRCPALSTIREANISSLPHLSHHWLGRGASCQLRRTLLSDHPDEQEGLWPGVARATESFLAYLWLLRQTKLNLQLNMIPET
jgi:hypothetical protein